MIEFSHTVECSVAAQKAWEFWSNVDNWAIVDPVVEAVTIDRGFVSGAEGSTQMKDGAVYKWVITAVDRGRSATIGMEFPGASVRFNWLFEDGSQGGARITQRVTLDGERQQDYSEPMEGLRQGMPDGMQRLVEAMVHSE